MTMTRYHSRSCIQCAKPVVPNAKYCSRSCREKWARQNTSSVKVDPWPETERDEWPWPGLTETQASALLKLRPQSVALAPSAAKELAIWQKRHRGSMLDRE